jgi:GTP-binding protein
MEVIHASYLISSPSVEQCPAPEYAEYAFIGRSNVGKSSVINMLCNKKELAKVSSSPGKTQLINHFTIVSSDRKTWYLVDLPGYGYAKRSQSTRKTWAKMIQDYIRKRENLGTLFILIDCNIKPQKIDIDFVNQLGEWRVPFAIIFTKADKSPQRETANNVNDFLRELQETWESLPQHFVTSAVKHTGAKQILRYIQEGNAAFELHKKQS